MDDSNERLARGVATVAANIALAAVGAPIGVAFGAGNGKGTWDPVVPADLHLAKLPPVAADGTVECWMCKSRVMFANANIADQAYVCTPCSSARAREQARASLPANADDIKLGRPKTGLFLLLGGSALIAVLVLVIYMYRW